MSGYRLHFEMNQANARRFPDWETSGIAVDVGGIVRLTYRRIRGADGRTLAWLDEYGYWIAAENNCQYSDVTIEAIAPPRPAALVRTGVSRAIRTLGRLARQNREAIPIDEQACNLCGVLPQPNSGRR